MPTHGVDRTGLSGGSGRAMEAFVEEFLDADSEAEALTALGVSAFAQTLLDDANAGAARTTLDAQEDVITTKGDVLVGGASGAATRKAVGSNGQLIVAASGETDGLIWTDYTREPINVNPNWRIDQINEGTLYTVNSSGVLGPDGWSGTVIGAGVFKMRAIADPDNAAKKVLEVTCTTADAAIAAGDLYALSTHIEGYDAADLMAGTASASKITVMFTSDFSVTGTYGLAITNSASDRSYVGTFTQAVANAREQQTVTLTLDTTGTWLYTNGTGIKVILTLAAGSDFHGTANQWQAGNKMSTSAQVNFMSSTSNIGYIGPFHVIPGGVALAYHKQDIQRELAKAQRYQEKTFDPGTAVAQASGTFAGVVSSMAITGSYGPTCAWQYKVTKRVPPTIVTYNPTQANANWRSTADSETVTLAVSSTGANTAVLSATAAPAVSGLFAVHATANARLS